MLFLALLSLSSSSFSFCFCLCCVCLNFYSFQPPLVSSLRLEASFNESSTHNAKSRIFIYIYIVKFGDAELKNVWSICEIMFCFLVYFKIVYSISTLFFPPSRIPYFVFPNLFYQNIFQSTQYSIQ